LVYMLVIFGIIRAFGSDAQAGFGIGMRIMTAAALPSMAISFALAAVAGQNFGAGHGDRVRESFRVGALFVCGWMVLLTVLFHVAPQALVGVFSRDPEVLAAGGDFLSIISWTLVASGLIATCGGMFQAVGNTMPPLTASAVRILLITTLALWLAARPGFQLWQLWWMSVVTIYLHLGLSLVLLRREFARRLMPLAALQP
jgi:Na+-driven multidrug efflux pump